MLDDRELFYKTTRESELENNTRFVAHNWTPSETRVEMLSVERWDVDEIAIRFPGSNKIIRIHADGSIKEANNDSCT